MDAGTVQRYPALFSPMTVAGLTAKNRAVMAPMERNYATPDGRVSPRTLAHYAERAAGGVGWIDVEATFISPEGRGRRQQLGLHDDAMISGFAELVALCHAHDVRVSVELHHAGRHADRSVTGLDPVAPSAVRSPESDMVCRALTDDGIGRILDDYRSAARRASEAGVDAVELHGAHGYLVHQFLSPITNLRDDQWGGSEAARREFATRAVEALRDGAGSTAVGCRLSIEEHLPGGFDEATVAALGQRLVAAGIDYISLSAGAIESPHAISPPMDMGPDGWLAPAAGRLRRAWGIPVFVAGRFLDAATAEQALADGHADAIVFGRALLADPAVIAKAARGAEADIVPCTSCNQGCVARIGQQLDATCTVNPRMGRETTIGREMSAAGRLRVIGGGPAGLVAAVEAAKAGIEVELVEGSSHLGGRLRAAIAENRPGWRRYLDYLERQLTALGVTVRLDTAVDGADTSDVDAVLIATGAVSDHLALGSSLDGGPTVLDPDAALERPATLGRTVISGIDATGVGTAARLVAEGVEVIAVVGSGALDDPCLGGLERALEQLAASGCLVAGRTEVRARERDAVDLLPSGAIGPVTPTRLTGVDTIVVADARRSAEPPPACSVWTERIGEALRPGDARFAAASALEAVARLVDHLNSNGRSAQEVP